MDPYILKNIIYILLLIILSAFFSGSETAFTSVNVIRIKHLNGEGNKRAKIVLELLEDFDKLLSTILIGNNIVNIGMTAIATLLFVRLYGDYGATISTVFITSVVLLFGEISPKSIAKQKAESLSLLIAPMLKVWVFLFTPLTKLFSFWKIFLKKIFNLEQEDRFTEDELKTLVDETSVEDSKKKLISNAIGFSELHGLDVLTPRVDIVAVDVSEEVEKIKKIFLDTGFSRIPVYEDDIDKICGVLTQKDFHNHVVTGEKTVEQVMRRVVFVAGAIGIDELFKKLQKMKSHIAIVIDEYGGTEGLVTMEDIIEELVGEIFDEHDQEILKDIIPLQNGSYRINGSANLSKVLEFFNLENTFDVMTINGFVSKVLGRLPRKGDYFEELIASKKLKVKVTSVDGRKALEINLCVEDIIEEELGETE